MNTKFEIGDKVKIVEKELPKTGVRYFDDVLENDVYVRNVKEYCREEVTIDRYFETDDFYTVETKDGYIVPIPAYFLESVPTVKYAVFASLHSTYSLPWYIAKFDTKEEAISYMREVVAKQASAAIKEGKEYKYKISDTVAILEDYCIFVKKWEEDGE